MRGTGLPRQVGQVVQERLFCISQYYRSSFFEVDNLECPNKFLCTSNNLEGIEIEKPPQELVEPSYLDESRFLK